MANVGEQLGSIHQDGDHIFNGSHAVGKIYKSGHIEDASGHKLGSIDEHGIVWDRSNHKIGSIGSDGQFYARNSVHSVGFAQGDHIYDHEGKKIGSSSSAGLAGAGLILLLNKKDDE